MAGPKVLIGIPSLMVKVGFTPFDVCLDKFRETHSVEDYPFFRPMGGVVVRGRNEIVREAIRRDAEYVWFLDDDQPFQSTDLEKLMAHDVEAVIALSCRRGAPFLPLLYDRLEGAYASQRYLLPHESGLIRVAGAGMAGLLIRVSVLKEMGQDGWFEFVHPENNFDDYAEDFPFYRRLQAMGVQLYCDVDVRFGHEFTCAVYPIKQNGQWFTVMADQEPICMIPQPVPPHDKLVFPSPAESRDVRREQERRRLVKA